MGRTADNRYLTDEELMERNEMLKRKQKGHLAKAGGWTAGSGVGGLIFAPILAVTLPAAAAEAAAAKKLTDKQKKVKEEMNRRQFGGGSMYDIDGDFDSGIGMGSQDFNKKTTYAGYDTSDMSFSKTATTTANSETKLQRTFSASDFTDASFNALSVLPSNASLANSAPPTRAAEKADEINLIDWGDDSAISAPAYSAPNYQSQAQAQAQDPFSKAQDPFAVAEDPFSNQSTMQQNSFGQTNSFQTQQFQPYSHPVQYQQPGQYYPQPPQYPIANQYQQQKQAPAIEYGNNPFA